MKAIINKSVVSSYGTPEDQVTLIDELFYGMVVTVEETLPSGWCFITPEYRYQGYVKSEQLLFDTEQIDRWETSHKVRIIQANADVLTEPKVQGAKLQEIPRGGLVIKQDDKDIINGWVPVLLADGCSGYMKEKFIEEIRNAESVTEEELRRNVIDTAKSYLGVQYRWGGKSPFGIDCSGLTSISYLINGILTFRDAQIVEGFPVREIPFPQRKPGDLLYFKGHIAMVLDEDQYLHSTGRNGSDGVMINSLNPKDAHYREDLATGIIATGSVFPVMNEDKSDR